MLVDAPTEEVARPVAMRVVPALAELKLLTEAEARGLGVCEMNVLDEATPVATAVARAVPEAKPLALM